MKTFCDKERYVNGLGTCIIVRLNIEAKKEIRRTKWHNEKEINYNNYHFSSSIVLYISHTVICQ